MSFNNNDSDNNNNNNNNNNNIVCQKYLYFDWRTELHSVTVEHNNIRLPNYQFSITNNTQHSNYQ